MPYTSFMTQLERLLPRWAMANVSHDTSRMTSLIGAAWSFVLGPNLIMYRGKVYRRVFGDGGCRVHHKIVHHLTRTGYPVARLPRRPRTLSPYNDTPHCAFQDVGDACLTCNMARDTDMENSLPGCMGRGRFACVFIPELNRSHIRKAAMRLAQLMLDIRTVPLIGAAGRRAAELAHKVKRWAKRLG